MIKAISVLALPVGAVFLLSSALLAQAPVASREAVPAQPPDNALQSVLERQSLREEISILRGIIEELEYQVNRLEKKQAENYSDLDSRVANLYSGTVQVAPAQTGSDSTSANTASSSTAPVPVNNDSTARSKALYDQGFSALRQGDREGAIQAFDLLVNDHANAKEAPDALYWLGETHWLSNEKEKSRQSFVWLLDATPDYRKAGDAMYRLGVIYDQLGDFDKAFGYMSQVLLSGSSQSVAAQTWLDEHGPQNAEKAESTTSSNAAATSIDE